MISYDPLWNTMKRKGIPSIGLSMISASQPVR